MTLGAKESEDTGLEVIDILSDPQYANRKPNARDVSLQMAGLERLAHAFVETPETILQQLVNAAVDLCGADSAGIQYRKTRSHRRALLSLGGHRWALLRVLERDPAPLSERMRYLPGAWPAATLPCLATVF